MIEILLSFFIASASADCFTNDEYPEGKAFALECPGGVVHDTRHNVVVLQDAGCFEPMTWAEANEAAATLGDGQCGLTDGSEPGDWRLMDDSLMAQFIYWCVSCPESEAWTSTTSPGTAYYAIYGSPVNRGISQSGKSYLKAVWPYREARIVAPEPVPELVMTFDTMPPEDPREYVYSGYIDTDLLELELTTNIVASCEHRLHGWAEYKPMDTVDGFLHTAEIDISSPAFDNTVYAVYYRCNGIDAEEDYRFIKYTGIIRGHTT